MTQPDGTVLVVDDEAMNRLLLVRSLEQEGLRVDTASDGLEALDMLRSRPFDLVLLDILMPLADGFEVLAVMKDDPTLAHVPVIVISALEDMESVVRCIEMGAEDYLPKPFDRSLLRARINAGLAKKRLVDLQREYLEQVGRVVDAAIAMEAERFDPALLEPVSRRTDALGQMARVFTRMARNVQAAGGPAEGAGAGAVHRDRPHPQRPAGGRGDRDRVLPEPRAASRRAADRDRPVTRRRTPWPS